MSPIVLRYVTPPVISMLELNMELNVFVETNYQIQISIFRLDAPQTAQEIAQKSVVEIGKLTYTIPQFHMVNKTLTDKYIASATFLSSFNSCSTFLLPKIFSPIGEIFFY